MKKDEGDRQCYSRDGKKGLLGHRRVVTYVLRVHYLHIYRNSTEVGSHMLYALSLKISMSDSTAPYHRQIYTEIRSHMSRKVY